MSSSFHIACVLAVCFVPMSLLLLLLVYLKAITLFIVLYYVLSLLFILLFILFILYIYVYIYIYMYYIIHCFLFVDKGLRRWVYQAQAYERTGHLDLRWFHSPPNKKNISLFPVCFKGNLHLGHLGRRTRGPITIISMIVCFVMRISIMSIIDINIDVHIYIYIYIIYSYIYIYIYTITYLVICIDGGWPVSSSIQ